MGRRHAARVEFFDFRKAHVHDRAFATANLINHFWQTMQRLWAKNDVDIVGALAQQFAFLRGHAAPNANNHVWIRFFEQLPAAELGEDFLLGFLSN